jgi:hypothetical protein
MRIRVTHGGTTRNSATRPSLAAPNSSAPTTRSPTCPGAHTLSAGQATKSPAPTPSPPVPGTQFGPRDPGGPRPRTLSRSRTPIAQSTRLRDAHPAPTGRGQRGLRSTARIGASHPTDFGRFRAHPAPRAGPFSLTPTNLSPCVMWWRPVSRSVHGRLSSVLGGRHRFSRGQRSSRSRGHLDFPEKRRLLATLPDHLFPRTPADRPGFLGSGGGGRRMGQAWQPSNDRAGSGLGTARAP